MNDPAALRDILRATTGHFGGDDALHAGTIWRHWREIVGVGIAAHAEPTSLRAGVLRVRTDTPTWATELSYLGDDIVRKANRKIGAEVVREVRVWTSPEPIRATRPRPPKAPAEASGSTVDDGAVNGPQNALAAAYAAWRKRRS